jgi:hypothetical protein
MAIISSNDSIPAPKHRSTAHPVTMVAAKLRRLSRGGLAVPAQYDRKRCMPKGWTKRALAAATVGAAMGFAWSVAQATPIPLGFVSWDVMVPGSFGEFDIVNETGPNSGGSFPVSTEVQFNS